MLRRSFAISLFALTLTASSQCVIDIPNDTLTIYYGYSPWECVDIIPADSGAAPLSYLWSNGDTSQMITVCDTTSSWYSVVMTDDTLCSSVDSVFIEVIDVRCGNNPNNQKVLVCHVPPGNPANEHTICISENAVAAHLAHGCYLGTCDSDTTMVTGPASQLLVEVSPNPLTETAVLTISSNVSQQVQIEVLDQTGRVVGNSRTLFVEGGIDELFSIERAGLRSAGSLVVLKVTAADGTAATTRLFIADE